MEGQYDFAGSTSLL